MIKNSGIFLAGGIFTLSCWFMYQQCVKKPSVNATEIAMGEVFYEQLQRCAHDCDIHAIAQVMKELEGGKRAPQSEAVRDQVIIDSAVKKMDEIAKENVIKVEAYLTKLAQKPDVMEIVQGKVYAEILEEGGEECISSQDAISIYFKEYDREGKVIKDTTEEKAFSIRLPQMIKGFQLGLDGAKVGERRKIYIHPDFGFGKVGRGSEPNQLLIYEVVIKEKLTK